MEEKSLKATIFAKNPKEFGDSEGPEAIISQIIAYKSSITRALNHTLLQRSTKVDSKGRNGSGIDQL